MQELLGFKFTAPFQSSRRAPKIPGLESYSGCYRGDAQACESQQRISDVKKTHGSELFGSTEQREVGRTRVTALCELGLPDPHAGAEARGTCAVGRRCAFPFRTARKLFRNPSASDMSQRKHTTADCA